MIIDETIEQSRKATISTSNSNSVGTFRIKESAKAFSILSSSLYQNPIRSIIRELGCNARDAHVAANNPEPWKLSLPSVLSPEFAVSDNGTGLSHEEVMQIYTTYFESTKTNSNEFVGALGLGSKSPFSYTDNFTVTSVKDGKKNIYSTFLTEERIPSIVLLDSSTTNDPNGVEVRFSVKSEDFHKFRSEAIEALKFFDQKPIGFPEGSEPTILLVNGIEHITSGVAGYSYSGKEPLVIMGGVQYTFDVKNAAFQKYSVLLGARSHMLIRADIGDVVIQPSREGLTMTKKTIEFISKKFEEALSKINADIEQKIKSAKTEWDAHIMRNEISNSGTEYEQRLVKSSSTKTFTLPSRFSGRKFSSQSHRKTAGNSSYFKGISNIRVSSNIEIIINDSKALVRDIHECIRKKTARGTCEVIEIEPIPGVSSEDLQKEIAKYTFGKVPILTSVLCDSLEKKKKIVGIVYQITRSGNKKDYSRLGYSLSRSSQEMFVDGSYFVELDRENNVVDQNGIIVDNFWLKIATYRELGGSAAVFAIKHNSNFDRSLYKRFLIDLDDLIKNSIKSLKPEQFFSVDQNCPYEVRNAFLYGYVKKIAPKLKDPIAQIVTKFNPSARSHSELAKYDGLYPGLTKSIQDEITKFKSELSEFIKRYESIIVISHRDKNLESDMIEFANWRYENKFLNTK